MEGLSLTLHKRGGLHLNLQNSEKKLGVVTCLPGTPSLLGMEKGDLWGLLSNSSLSEKPCLKECGGE